MGETDAPLRALLGELARVEPAQPAPRISVGDTLGRYRLVRELGRGGFGVVFAARDPELDREVAVKVMRRRGHDDPRLREQFHREASIVARLRHPYIVTVYDWSRDGDTPYLVLELLSGETLEERLRRGPMPFDEALDLALAVADALAHAHASGAVHRDLKPSNVFLCRDGVAKVLDFGLAYDARGDGPLDGTRAGTPGYMAPEQRRGAGSDARSDVWAFGLLVYELLTGRRAQSDAELADGARLALDVPAPLSATIARALAPEPGDRFVDGAALLVELAGVRQRLRVEAQRRRVLRWAALATAAAALAVAGVVVAMQLVSAAHVRRAAEAAAEVNRIESELRFAYLAPAHDTRPDERRARRELEALERRLSGMGTFARGRGEHALGRGLLALGDAAAAIEHLRAAQSLGDDTAEVRRTLGEALGAEWETRIRELDGLRNGRDAEERRLDEELRLPATRLLEAAHPTSALVLARLALWRGRDDEALALARRAADEAPWLYEADLVAAEVYTRGARAALHAGRFADALAALDRAERAAARAADLGRSDPDVHRDACDRGLVRAEIENASSRPTAAAAESARAACDRALAVAPDDVPAHRLAILLRLEWAEEAVGDRARLEKIYAEAEALVAHAREVNPRSDDSLELEVRLAVHQAVRMQNLGQDPTALVARSLPGAEALYTRHASENTGDELADLLFVQARAQADRGVDPTPSCRRIEEVLAHASTKAPLMRLGRAAVTRGEWESAHGVDPGPAWQRAVDAYGAALRLAPGDAKLLDEASAVYYDLALDAQSLGGDGAAEFRRAVELGEQALALRPKAPTGLANLGVTLEDFAQAERSWGRDPSALVDRAAALLTRSSELEPGAPDTWFSLAVAERVRAEVELDRRADPSRAIAQGRAAAAHALSLSPGNGSLTAAEADLDRVQARWDAAAGRSPEAAFAKSEVLYDRLRAADPANSGLILATVGIVVERLEWRARHGGGAVDVDAARKLLAPLCAARRPSAEALRLDARLLLFAARAAAPAARCPLVAEARAALARVVSRPPRVRELADARAELARASDCP